MYILHPEYFSMTRDNCEFIDHEATDGLAYARLAHQEWLRVKAGNVISQSLLQFMMERASERIGVAGVAEISPLVTCPSLANASTTVS